MSYETDMKYLLSEIESIKNRLRFQERLETPSISPWTTYTPTITYSGGTTDPDSETIDNAEYIRIGNFVYFAVRVSYTRGAGNRTTTIVSLPIEAGQTQIALSGWERVSTGNQLTCPAWINTVTTANIQHGTMTTNNFSAVAGGYFI